MTFLHSDAENIRSSENLPVTVHPGAGEASVLIAEEIAALIKQKEKSNDHCVLGLPTGSFNIELNWHNTLGQSKYRRN